jgi:hypothetical protein
MLQTTSIMFLLLCFCHVCLSFSNGKELHPTKNRSKGVQEWMIKKEVEEEEELELLLLT